MLLLISVQRDAPRRQLSYYRSREFTLYGMEGEHKVYQTYMKNEQRCESVKWQNMFSDVRDEGQDGRRVRISRPELGNRYDDQRCSVRCGWCHLIQAACSNLQLYRRHVSQPAPWCREYVDPALRTWTRTSGEPMK